MDPIANMLTQIRNAQAVFKEDVAVSFSNINYKIAKILEKYGFVENVEKRGRAVKKNIKITLKYNNGNQGIAGLKKISKPGHRIYASKKEMKPVRGGFGIAIISTSKGIMTDKEARKKNLGGEIIAEIW